MYPLLIFFPVAKGLPLLQNITIPLPNGSSDHENPGLLCTPTKWSDIIIFYPANYAAHAATTRSLPGEKTRGIIMVVLIALFFPAAGAFRGILGITSLAIWAKTDLEMAAKAGALFMVVRGPDWEPRDGNTLENTILCLSVQQTKGGNSSLENPLPIASSQEDAILGINTGKPEGRNFRFVMYDPPWNFTDFIYGDDLSQSQYQIHGNHHLPPGYCISLVPRNATFIEPPLKRTTLSYNYNWVKVLISLGQAIYTIFTLYQARGDQIERFGYAAFGLTVAPYAVVSVLNLLGSGLCPEFAALSMVESSIIKEAVKRGEGCFFMGTVGELGEDIFRQNPSAEQGDTLQSPQWTLESVFISKDSEEDSKYLKVKSAYWIEASRVTLANDQGRDSTAAKESNKDATGNKVRPKRHATSVLLSLAQILFLSSFAETLIKKKGIGLTPPHRYPERALTLFKFN
jgi:hypothetical protein